MREPIGHTFVVKVVGKIFIITHWEQFINLHPRREALKTPIEDPKKVEHEGWGGRTYYNTEITKKEIDNNEQIG